MDPKHDWRILTCKSHIVGDNFEGATPLKNRAKKRGWYVGKNAVGDDRYLCPKHAKSA